MVEEAIYQSINKVPEVALELAKEASSKSFKIREALLSHLEEMFKSGAGNVVLPALEYYAAQEKDEKLKEKARSLAEQERRTQ